MKIDADENELRMTNKLGVVGRAFAAIMALCTGLLNVGLLVQVASDPMGFLDPRGEGWASIAIGVVMGVVLIGLFLAGFLFLIYLAIRPNEAVTVNRVGRTIRRAPQSVFRRDALQYDLSEVRGFTSRHVRVRASGYEVVQLVTTDGAKIDLTPFGLTAAERDELVGRLEEFIKCKKDSTN